MKGEKRAGERRNGERKKRVSRRFKLRLRATAASCVSLAHKAPDLSIPRCPTRRYVRVVGLGAQTHLAIHTTSYGMNASGTFLAVSEEYAGCEGLLSADQV